MAVVIKQHYIPCTRPKNLSLAVKISFNFFERFFDTLQDSITLFCLWHEFELGPLVDTVNAIVT